MALPEPAQAVLHSLEIGLGGLRAAEGIHVKAAPAHVVDAGKEVVGEKHAVAAHPVQQGPENQPVDPAERMIGDQENRTGFRNPPQILLTDPVADTQHPQAMVNESGFTRTALRQQPAIMLVQAANAQQRLQQPFEKPQDGPLPVMSGQFTEIGNSGFTLGHGDNRYNALSVAAQP